MATPTEVATTLGTDGKTFRKFLRSITPKDEQPGKGGRWALPDNKREIAKLGKQFKTWHAAEMKARADRATKAAEDAADEVTTDGDDEEIELEA